LTELGIEESFQDDTCRQVEEELLKHGVVIKRKQEDEKSCLIDFAHPRIKDFYWSSSVVVDKVDPLGRPNKTLNTTARAPAPGEYKELYLGYCCEHEPSEEEKCVNVCRPHFFVQMGKPIVSVQASFHKSDMVSRFAQLINDVFY